MKKSILFLFTFIPLFTSCNKNSNGFVNPFPEDGYHPTGFNFKDEERVSRPLTLTEQALVNDTIENGSTDLLIKEHHVSIETRDYTRAFAGEFEQGYSASNIAKTETRVTFAQEAKESSNPIVPLRRRTVTSGNSTDIYDYSYGHNTSEVETKEWIYFAKDTEDAEDDPKTVEEAENEGDAKYIVSKSHSSESSTDSARKLSTFTPGDTEPTGTWSKEPDEVFSRGLKHSEFLTKLSDCSSTPGADKQDNVILVKEDHTLYGEDKSGIYALPDGRTYQAMVNTITISRLTKQTTKLSNDDIVEWYLVSYARRYTETTITSEIIQPNVPIQMLSNPIVINYVEEEHAFSTKTSESSSEDLKEIIAEDEQ